MEIVGVIAFIAIVLFIVLSSSFESKTLRVAMNALQITMHKFPESSAEYFPPPAIMKATLKSNFFPEQARASLQRDYGQVKAESAAYHLLDYVGHLFIQNSKPDMGGWCLAARDTLEAHVR